MQASFTTSTIVLFWFIDPWAPVQRKGKRGESEIGGRGVLVQRP